MSVVARSPSPMPQAKPPPANMTVSVTAPVSNAPMMARLAIVTIRPTASPASKLR
nr:hypothetical protein [uncultured Undibacterium sp.]